MGGAFHNGMSHSTRDWLKSFVGGTCHDIDGFESELLDCDTRLIFGVTDGLLDGFVQGGGGGFVDKLEMKKGLGGRQGAHCVGNETKLSGTGADVSLDGFHNFRL